MPTNTRGSAQSQRLETATVRTSDLQQLLGQQDSLGDQAPAAPWNIREEAAKLRNTEVAPKRVSLKTSDLQQLLEAEENALRAPQPENAWDIRQNAPKFRGNSPKVEAKLTELQKLLQDQQLDSLSLQSPENPWNIRNSSPKFGKKPVESVIIKTTDLQKLLSDQQLDDAFGFQSPDSPWNIRDSSPKFGKKPPESVTVKTTELQKLFSEQELNALGFQSPSIPWNIRDSSLKFGKKPPESITVRTTELQKFLNDQQLDALDFQSPDNPWNIRESSPKFRKKPVDSVTIKTTELQKLLSEQQLEALGLNQPNNPWNIRNSSPKFKDNVQIKTTDLQKLLENLQKEQLLNTPNNTWNIRDGVPKFQNPDPVVTIKLTELQRLLEDQPESLAGELPASIWNIRASAPKFVAGQAISSEETVTIRTTDLQKLLEQTQPTGQPLSEWNIRGSAQNASQFIKDSDLQKLFSVHGLAGTDGIPQNGIAWNIRAGSERFRGQEADGKAVGRPKLKATELQELLVQNGLVLDSRPLQEWNIRAEAAKQAGGHIQLTDLQQLLEGQGIAGLQGSPLPANPWDIRESTKKFRQMWKSFCKLLLDNWIYNSVPLCENCDQLTSSLLYNREIKFYIFWNFIQNQVENDRYCDFVHMPLKSAKSANMTLQIFFSSQLSIWI